MGYRLSMGPLEYALGVSVLATVWFLPIGAMRTLAYTSSDVDHSPGMRNIAYLALALGAVSAVTMVVLTILVARQ